MRFSCAFLWRRLSLTGFGIGAGALAACGTPSTPTPVMVTATCNGTPDACTIPFGASATIAWTSMHAQSCSVADTNWSGLSGSQSTGALSANRQYQVQCRGAGSSDTLTVTVNVTVGAPPAPSSPVPLPAPGAFNVSGGCTPIDSMQQLASLNWTAASNAAGYRIDHHEWSTNPFLPVTTINATSYAQPVTVSADHYWRVVAINESGETVSTPGTISVSSLGGPTSTPPTSPPSMIPGGPGTPYISISPPPLGGFADMTGQVLHVDISHYYVEVYIRVGSAWWSKPTSGAPTTMIRNDGTFTTDITTGGQDETANTIAAFVVSNSRPPDVVLGTGSLPIAVNGTTVVAGVTVNR